MIWINYLRRGGRKPAPKAMLMVFCLTHRGFYIQTLLHTNIFTPKGFIHSRSSTQTVGHTNILTQCFYTQTCLHTDTFKNTNLFTHGPVYAYTECCTQTLLHTDAFTQKHLDTEPHLKSNGNGRFGPNPRTLLEPDFKLSRLAGRQLDFPSGIKGKRSFLATS